MHKNKTILSIFCLLIIIIFPLTNSLLPEKKRKFLFNKYIRKISKGNIRNFKSTLNNGYPFDYDISKIQTIIREYNFPDSYDFIENEKPTYKNVKNQEACGSCWSMASTTALAYRFHKKGVEVDLSPQNGLSCYIRSCDRGNYALDSQLHLVRNGTVTEQCIEYSSGEKIIEQCRTSCKNPDIKYEKYYAKSAFQLNVESIDETNFYEIVILIIDELVRNGPVMAFIDSSYQDFQDWFIRLSQQECHEKVYRHIVQEGEKLNLDHAITIVGYGVINSQYYWLVQNSWGKLCDNGFVKIEFGQIGIESVISFVEPFIENNNIINVNMNNWDNECSLKIDIIEDINKWKNPLLVQFKHKNKEKYFNYICDIENYPYLGLGCNFELKNIADEQEQGEYIFNEYKALGPYGLENHFILGENLKKLEFFFYGYKPLNPLTEDSLKYFISREGSKISFKVDGHLSVKELSPIYPNINIKESLNKCYSNTFTLNGNEVQIGNCEIGKNEVKYFEDITTSKDSLLISKILCGLDYPTNIYVYLLDTKKYPIFKISGFNVLDFDEKSSTIKTKLKAKIEGNIPEKDNFGTFTTYVNVGGEKENNNEKLVEMNCQLGKPTKIVDDYIINCDIINNGYSKKQKFYLYPFYYINDYYIPFEVIIPKKMENKSSFQFPKHGLYIFLYLLLLI